MNAFTKTQIGSFSVVNNSLIFDQLILFLNNHDLNEVLNSYIY